MAGLALPDLLLHTLQLVAAVVYIYVAAELARRPVDAALLGPLRGFVIWWGGLGVITILGVVFATTVQPTYGGIMVWRAVIYPLVAAILIMVAGLVYYLLYLYSGSRSWLRYVVGFYLVSMALIVYALESQGPYIGAGVDGSHTLLYENERPVSHPLSIALGLTISLPPLGAALAYLGLFFRVRSPTSKYRIALTSGGIGLWFGFQLATSLARAATNVRVAGFESRLVSQLLGLGAALLVLLAYHPPRWAQRRWGVVPLRAEATGLPETRDEPDRTAGLPTAALPGAV